MHWPDEGTPDHPRGWLIQTGSRKLPDQMRSEQARRRRQGLAALPEPPAVESTEARDRDDTLTVFFMCCHPSLTAASTIALTLRAIGGLTTAEIAKEFRTSADREFIPLAEQDRTRSASINCLQPSPRCTTGPPGSTTPIGRKSLRCTACSNG